MKRCEKERDWEEANRISILAWLMGYVQNCSLVWDQFLEVGRDPAGVCGRLQAGQKEL
jgi:hypothetical protein